ncbi:uncharacterized protein MELLADRAFT_118051 [Melampsora larici-populina 98AG31]|uniref:Ubiquitin-like modifier-activating enzyme ATG7 n=1 Tax=Melampsora larici-populina (strain 98AG31 / pathotype 3-4-7) TaxID=747676 RepID=F4S4P9_MELLP|nr:uncharacterized protein MELLADRAFT_118051 [Melampsora larici-populina 98AG31]EGG00390.1 hypothetical protein MELLADRAFT_118051 [Melampsora larici-populina 98AG31]
MTSVLQFIPFSSSIDPTFWHTLTKLKIDVLKLGDQPIPIKGIYERGRWVKDKEHHLGKEIGLGGEIRLDGKSFDLEISESSLSTLNDRVTMFGVLKNFNTIEEFKACDKQSLFNQYADEMWNSLGQVESFQTKSPTFLVITFSDLKKYKYFYWFAYPAFIAKPSWMNVGNQGVWSDFNSNETHEIQNLLNQSNSFDLEIFKGNWIGKKLNGKWVLDSTRSWHKFFEGVLPIDRYLFFIDPSAHPQAVGWPLRNLLAELNKLHGSDARHFQVVAFRDPLTSKPNMTVTRSLITTIELPDQEPQSTGRPSAIGWEKNSAGKLGPKMADLGPMMDPTRLADQAVDLNLKLMRWRILPDLNLDKIASARCLLLGAGTLGCYVARTLMAWGVRKITFVDSSTVSFSNPVRQPLFEFNDCLEGGKPKAACAAASLKRIYPGVDATGIQMSIPMPGHPIPAHLVDQVQKDVKRLEDLFDEHDVIYLLMDSRESRWLPTVLGASKRKLVMNAALGFDSYLVMRHGVRSSKNKTLSGSDSLGSSTSPAIQQLGCYFCNDIVAPTDSLTDRTLDQMCTVTRPGLAAIASATVVEVMASVLQHPDGPEAMSEVPNLKKDEPNQETVKEKKEVSSSVLGDVPHQIRGFLSKFESMKLVGPAYEKCTGCSESVVKAYESKGFEMIKEVLNEVKYLEKLTGLDLLYDESEAMMEKVDWDEDDDEL